MLYQYYSYLINRKLAIPFLLLLTTLNFHSCGQKSNYGVTKLDDFKEYDMSRKDKDGKIDNHKIVPDEAFKLAIKEHTERLRNKEKKRLSEMNDNVRLDKLKSKSKKKIISNLEKLGVINITERLKGPNAKINKKLINKLEKKQIFIKNVDGNKDRFGGKLICNKEVLTHRIDRTNFISCLKKQDSLEKLTLFTFFVNRNLTSIADVKPNDVKQGCKVSYAVSIHSYHELTECLIHDFEEGGFFKFRNINSLGVKFDIL